MVGWTVAGTEVDCRHGALALGGLDEFVFTAGIGENSLSMRAHIAEKLGWLGAVLDPAGNAARQTLISGELMVARQAGTALCARNLSRSPRDGLVR